MRLLLEIESKQGESVALLTGAALTVAGRERANRVGRPKGAWTPDLVRSRIQVSKLLNRLHDHVYGRVELTLSQVRSATFLIERVIPRAEAPDPGHTTTHALLAALIRGDAKMLPPQGLVLDQVAGELAAPLEDASVARQAAPGAAIDAEPV